MNCTRDCKRSEPVDSTTEGLYLHVPFCDGKCRYCAFYSVKYDPPLADRFVSCARTELTRYCASGEAPAPGTVYFGGGTPTVLTAGQLERLCRVVTDCVAKNRLREWTVETNPGSIDADKARVLASAGVNRITVGAQSFSGEALRTMGRRHSVSDIYEAVDIVRQAGISNVGMDLIASIPGGDDGTWTKTLTETVAIAPSHVSVYALTAEEGTALARQCALGEFVMEDEESELAALDEAERVLSGAGYVRYEISNYALPGFECLHNIGYWRGAEYIGIGPSAASFRKETRTTNAPSLEEYVASLENGRPPASDSETLSPLTRAAELLAFGLRMKNGVDMEEIRRRVGGGLNEQLSRWSKALGDLKAEGVATGDGMRWALTPRGRNIADYVAVELMP